MFMKTRRKELWFDIILHFVSFDFQFSIYASFIFESLNTAHKSCTRFQLKTAWTNVD